MAKAAAKKTGKTLKERQAKEQEKGQELITVKSGALSTDIGPAVIAELDKSYVKEAKIQSELASLAAKRYDVLARLTMGIVKAFKADDSIDRGAIFSDDKKRIMRLNNQIGLALGIREANEFNGKQVINYSSSVAKFFPTAKDDKNSDAYKRKSSLRTNFLHQLKKCTAAAVSIVENDIEVEQDEESGTLLLSGPAVAKQYGQPSVLLNEKQSVENENGEKVQLKAKPSYTSLGEIAASKAGATVSRRIDSRKTIKTEDSEKKPANAETAFVDACDTLGRLVKRRVEEGITEKEEAALRKLYTAIEQSGFLESEKDAA